MTWLDYLLFSFVAAWIYFEARALIRQHRARRRTARRFEGALRRDR